MKIDATTNACITYMELEYDVCAEFTGEITTENSEHYGPGVCDTRITDIGNIDDILIQMRNMSEDANHEKWDKEDIKQLIIDSIVRYMDYEKTQEFL